MKYTFSKAKFLEHASLTTKKRLSKHLDELDGMDVTFNDVHGYIRQYLKDGADYYLYPVYKSWCDESLGGDGVSCKDCKHFIGLGDFGLCCDLKYDLVYDTSSICSLVEKRESDQP